MTPFGWWTVSRIITILDSLPVYNCCTSRNVFKKAYSKMFFHKKCPEFNNVNQVHGQCLLFASLQHFQQFTEALASCCFLQSHIMMTEWPAWTKQTSPQIIGLLTYSFSQTWLSCSPPSSHTRWLISVVWGRLWRHTRGNSFLSHSFSTHLLAPASSYFWYNTALTWL